MYGIVLLVVVALLSLLVARVATIALTATGMARSSARFQARSALTGVGFTTREAEAVVSHPARRRIVMALMLVGNVGFVTAVAGLLSGLIGTADLRQAMLRAGVLIAGLAVVYAVSLSPAVDRRLSRVIGRFLSRYGELDVRDYAALLHVSGDYAVKELVVGEDGWLTQAPLGDLRLRDEGVLVLGIIRADGSYLGAPDRSTRVRPGETLVLYGRTGAIAALSRRSTGRAGEDAHREQIAEQHEVARREREADPGR